MTTAARPGVGMSGECRVEEAVIATSRASSDAALFHERCTMTGCGCTGHGAPSPARRPLLAWCRFCQAQLDETTAVAIGFKESVSGPGWPWYADDKCKVAYGVIPLSEHPADSDGRIRFRGRGPFVPRAR